MPTASEGNPLPREPAVSAAKKWPAPSLGNRRTPPASFSPARPFPRNTPARTEGWRQEDRAAERTGIMPWYLFATSIYGGLLGEPAKSLGFCGLGALQRPKVLRHNSSNYGGVL